ncbi:sugar-binding domain-containing protein [Pedobacter sp. UYEF25]
MLGNAHNKSIAIYFDGVYKNSEVWINGHVLGKRSNGFISFEYDLTPYLYKTGKTLWLFALIIVSLQILDGILARG